MDDTRSTPLNAIALQKQVVLVTDGTAALRLERIVITGASASTAGPKAIEGPSKTEDGPARCPCVIVMTSIKSHLSDDSTKWTRQEFPMSEISDMWEKGNAISVISSGTKEWSIVWRKKHASDRQSLQRCNDINPDTAVQNFSKTVTQEDGKGRALALMGCRAGSIISIFQPKRDGEKFHTYVRQGNFDSAWIKESWREGRNVVALVFFEGWWVVHTASNRIEGNQALLVNKAFPKASIKEYWDKGYIIQVMAASPNQWVIIMGMTETSKGWAQRYLCAGGDDFPSEFMKQQWKEDMVVTAITGN